MINGLTDYAHPCQALADLFTLKELVGPLEGQTLAYVGDANNVARSLAEAAASWACKFAIASPQGVSVRRRVSRRHLARRFPTSICSRPTDPAEAVRGAIGRLHRRLDQHGAGERERASPQRLRRLSR